MHTLFYSNISEFSGNLEGILDEGTYKTTIHNMHKLGRKSKLFKSANVLMLGHGCGVSQYPQFYERIKIYISNVTTSICGKLYTWKGSPIFQEPWNIALSKSVETFIMVSISDMKTSQCWQKLGSMMDKAK